MRRGLRGLCRSVDPRSRRVKPLVRLDVLYVRDRRASRAHSQRRLEDGGYL